MLSALRVEPNGALRADFAPIDGVDSLTAAIDGTHQVLSAWSGSHTGWLALPVGAVQWVFGAQPAPGPLQLQGTVTRSPQGVVAEVSVVDKTGAVVLRGSAVQLKQATRWPSDAPEQWRHHA